MLQKAGNPGVLSVLFARASRNKFQVTAGGRCWLLLVLLWCGLISGCQHSNQLVLFSLSEAELNQQLRQSFTTFTQDVRVAGIPLQFNVDRLEAQIAPEGQPLIELQLHTQGHALMTVFKMPLQLALTLRAEPYFDQQRQAVYLRRFQVISSELTAGRWQGKLKPLNREFEQILQQLLAERPVYRLDPQKLSHKALLNMPLAIRLTPGKLLLSPAY